MSSASSSSPNTNWGPTADLDPTTVPIYPVVSAEITDDERVLVNGQQIPVRPGMTAAQTVVDAAAQEAQMLPGAAAAIRVSVTMSGYRHPLVVTTDKRVIPLDQPGGRSRPAWLLPMSAAALAVLLIIAATTTYLVTHIDSTPRPAASTTPLPAVLAAAGPGANLPVPAPPDFAQQATWSVAIDRAIAPAVAGQSVLVVTSDHHLTLLDPVSGQPYWRAKDTPAGVMGVHLTHIDGQMVAATATTQTLTYWPIPAQPTRATAAGPAESDGISVDLPQQGTVVWAPSSPVIQLPDQTAGVIKAGKVVTFDVPVGAQVVDADHQAALALDQAGHWWHLTPGQVLPPPGTLSAPKAAVGQIMRAVAVDVDHVLGIWPTASASVVAGLVELAGGQLIAELSLAAGTDTGTPMATPLSDPSGHRIALGAVVADATSGQLYYLAGSLRAQSIAGSHVYALDPYSKVVDVQLAGDSASPQPPQDTTTAIPLGIVQSEGRQLAIVAADKVDQRLMYALPSGA